jgi:hypothetical protein
VTSEAIAMWIVAFLFFFAAAWLGMCVYALWRDERHQGMNPRGGYEPGPKTTSQLRQPPRGPAAGGKR